MRLATPFHSQLVACCEPYANLAESLLWFFSVLLGLLTCKVIYDVMEVLSPVLFRTYSNLVRVKQVEWDNRFFSTAHALFCTVTAGYLLFISDAFSPSTAYGPVTFRSTILSYFILAFSTGYFLADLVMILWTYPHLGGPEYVLHHLLSIGSLLLANYTAHAHFYLLMVLFSEVSTPFINIRWYLLTSGLKESRYFLYNGLTLIVVWLFARVILFGHLFYHMYSNFHEIRELFLPGFVFIMIAPTTLAVMNLYWFYKIIAGAIRVVSRKRDLK